ncbi:MAG: hypothetical protein ACXAEX_12710 [Promethearchaeota archaeon]|jgi:uncharacterized protein YjgD (DUF1641 family)
MNSKAQLLVFAENLVDKYEIEDKCGILFKLEKNKDPIEIFGVLDFLKFKLEKWGNTNVFSYLGGLFKKNTILIIGANNAKEATSIVKYVYLSQVIKRDDTIDQLLGLIEKLENIDDFEDFLNKEISNNLKMGCPNEPKLEIQLRDHLNKLLES